MLATNELGITDVVSGSYVFDSEYVSPEDGQFCPKHVENLVAKSLEK
jgi:hypothetical protein